MQVKEASNAPTTFPVMIDRCCSGCTRDSDGQKAVSTNVLCRIRVSDGWVLVYPDGFEVLQVESTFRHPKLHSLFL